jgi:hypothetical protein
MAHAPQQLERMDTMTAAAVQDACALEEMCEALDRLVKAAADLPEAKGGNVAFRTHYSGVRERAMRLALAARDVCDAGRR